jgi:hypothetical protein
LAIKGLFSGERLQMCSMHPDKLGPPVVAKTFAIPEKLDEAVKWAVEQNAKRNVYWQPNAVRAESEGDRPTRGDIASARALQADIDPAEDETPAAAKDRLIQFASKLRGTAAQPTCAVFSGGGVQLLFLLSRAVPIRGDTEVEQIESANRAIEAEVGAGGTHEINRLMRLPGTVNWPNASKRARGRQPTLAEVIYLDATHRVVLEEADRLVRVLEDVAEQTGLVRQKKLTKTSTRFSAPSKTKAAKEWKGYHFVSTEDAIHLIDLMDPEADGVNGYDDWQPVVSNILMLTNGDPDVVKRLESWHDGRTTTADNAKEVRQKIANWKMNGWDTKPNDAARRLADKVIKCAAKGRLEEAEKMAAFLRTIQASIEFLSDDDGNADYAQFLVPSFAEYVARAKAANDGTPDWLTELNKGYAVIKGQDRIAHFTDDGDVSFMSEKAFKLWHQQTVPLGNGRKPKGCAWLQHPRRRGYAAIGVWPVGKEPDGAYNQFKGLTVEPKTGEWPRTAAFIRDVICSGDAALNNFVLDWIADFLRDPTRKGYTVLALVGDEGVGKSFFGKTLLGGYLHESNWFEPTDKKHLIGNFNAHLMNKVFLVCDEAIYGRDKEARGIFKALVTEERMTIERKHHDAIAAPNALTMVFCSNNVHTAVPVSEGDRRSTIIQVAEHRKSDIAYFEGLAQALQDGERAAFLDAMSKRDLSGYNRRVPFMTAAKLEAVRANASATAQWWLENVEAGRLPGLVDSIRLMGLQSGVDWDKEPVTVLTDAMWSDFQSWQQQQRRGHPENQVEWGRMMQQCPDRTATRPRVTGDSGAEDPIACGKLRRARGYVYPPRAKCLEVIRRQYGLMPGDTSEVD